MSVDNPGAGGLPRGPNGEPIQVASSIQTQDDTGTPEISPKTVTNGAVITLIVPDNAVVCNLTAFDNDLRFGDNATLDGTGDGKGYNIIPSGSSRPVACAGMAKVYLLGDTATVVTGFDFEMLVKVAN